MELFTNYIDKGGLIFIILVCISVFTFAIVLYKLVEYLFFNQLRLDNLEKKIDDYSSFQRLKDDINNNEDLSENSFIVKLLNVTESDRKTNSNIKTKSFLEEEFRKSERFLPSLEIISQTSPLVGLLGTVIGMIDSFNQLELGGSVVDPSVLAGGIWTALLTTAMGLIVAIPALIFYFFFDKQISSNQDRTQSIALKILEMN